MNHRRVELTSLSIGKVARRAGIGVETIRFYEREGLLAAPARRDKARFTNLRPFWRRYVGALRRIVMLRLMPSVCYRRLFQSAYWRLSWAGRRTEALCLGRSSRCSTVF
jgi:hypothetical protein